MRHVHIAATRNRLLREAREADYTAWQQMAVMIGLNAWAHWRYSPWMRHANRRHQQPLGNLFLERTRRQKGGDAST